MNGATTKNSLSSTMSSSRYTIVFFLFLSLKASNGLFSCLQSAPTIAFVDHCPRDKTEWDRAAGKKNCHSMATRQNCTDAAKFQYHCLLNSHRNATLEVCAPIFYLQGYCPVYDIGTKEIMENYIPGYECLKFSGTEQCPSRYPSSEAYKYLQCYKTYSKDPVPSRATKCISKAASGSETIYIPVIVVLSVISMILFLTVIVLVILLKKIEIPKILDNLCVKGNQKQKNPSGSNDAGESHTLLTNSKETGEDEQNTRKAKETDEGERKAKETGEDEQNTRKAKETGEDEQNTRKAKETDEGERKVTGKNENETKPPKGSKRPARPPTTYRDKK